MSYRLFGKNIPPDCSYCEYCVESMDGAQFCTKNKAIINGKCRKFSYDPLLRKPFKPPVLPKYNPEDFEL